VPTVGPSITVDDDDDDDDDDGVGIYFLLIFGGQRDICIEEQRYVLGLCMLANDGQFVLLCFLKAKWHYFSTTINTI